MLRSTGFVLIAFAGCHLFGEQARAQPTSLPEELLRTPSVLFPPVSLGAPGPGFIDTILDPPGWRPVSASLSHSFYTFDRYEDVRLEHYDAQLTTLDLGFLIGKRNAASGVHPAWASLLVSVPWIDVSIDEGLGEETFHGLSDIGVTAYLPLFPGARAEEGSSTSFRSSWLVGLGLPTGDSDEGLGYGELTYSAGVLLTWDVGNCSSLFCARRPGKCPGGGGATCEDRLWPDPKPKGGVELREAIYPRRQARIQASYTHIPANEDLSYVEIRAGGLWGWEHLVVEAALDALAETGDGLPSTPFSRDANRKLDLDIGLRFRIDTPDRDSRQAWYITVGLRAPLVHDGLEDDFTPTLGLAGSFGRLPSSRKVED